MTQRDLSETVTPGTTPESVPLSYPSIAPTPPKFEASSSIPGYQPPATIATGAPLPHRPRGRFLIAALLLCFIGGVGFYFYDSYVRYVAYGQVVGRKIELAPPWAGVVTALHVRIGDFVRQGDPLFNVDSIKMRHQMAKIEDSLNLQRARLASELARLKWEAERVQDAQQLVRSEYYEKWSELLWEESVLEDLQQQLKRGETLKLHDAISVQNFESTRCRVAGQSQRIEQLTKAVQSLKRRLQNDRPIDPNLNDQIKPSLVNIENLQAELRRTRQLLEQGVVTSPANGRVTQIRKYAGEYVEDNGSVVELFVDGSAEIVLYLPQAKSQQWSTGDSLNVRISPAAARLTCQVTRVAPEMKGAPKSITRHYAADEILLPIIVRPTDPKQAEQLVLGSKVQLPRDNAESGLDAIAAWLRGDEATTTIDLDPVSPPRQMTRQRLGTTAPSRTVARVAPAYEPEAFGLSTSARSQQQMAARERRQVETLAGTSNEGNSRQRAPIDSRPADQEHAEHLDLGSKMWLLRAKADLLLCAIADWMRDEMATTAGAADQREATAPEPVSELTGTSRGHQSDALADHCPEAAISRPARVVCRPADPRESENTVRRRHVQVPGAKDHGPFRTIAARLRSDPKFATIDTRCVTRAVRTPEKQIADPASGWIWPKTHRPHPPDSSTDHSGNRRGQHLARISVPPD